MSRDFSCVFIAAAGISILQFRLLDSLFSQFIMVKIYIVQLHPHCRSHSHEQNQPVFCSLPPTNHNVAIVVFFFDRKTKFSNINDVFSHAKKLVLICLLYSETHNIIEFSYHTQKIDKFLRPSTDSRVTKRSMCTGTR